LLPKRLISVDKGKEEVRDLTWTALLILALILSPTATAAIISVNVHIAKPAGSAASPISTEQPVLRDPIDTDGPGATCIGGVR
jgi:hypothetical protein